MKHGLSFDVEDYHQIIYQDYFHKTTTPSDEVERNTYWLLDTLADAHIKATFFVLANVALAFPSLARRIVQDGHEIGSHGYDHKYIAKITPAAFRDEMKRAKEKIEDISGGQVFGHRAPAFSITPDSLWAFDILLELGFSYDSSIYPFAGKRYGIKNTDQHIYRAASGLFEIPLSCIELAGKTIPVAGGGYFRHFPYWWTKFAIKQLEMQGRPAIVFMHPYEFEISLPGDYPYGERIPLRLRKHNFLQGHNRGKKQREKHRALLSDFSFVPLKNLLPGQ